MMFDSYQRRR